MNKKQLLKRLRGMHTLLHQTQQILDVAMQELMNGLQIVEVDQEDSLEALELPIQQPSVDLSTAIERTRKKWDL